MGLPGSYPIVYFNAMHPGEDIDLESDPGLVAIGQNTVDLVNQYNAWSPTNGMCLAWPSAARVVTNASYVLERFQMAANSTMMNNFLPYIVNHPNSGYGCNMENSGATVAVNDLLVSVHGQDAASTAWFLAGGWPAGEPVAFRQIRLRGGVLASATALGTGVAPGGWFPEPLTLEATLGGTFLFRSPWQNASLPVVLDTTTGAAVPCAAAGASKFAFAVVPGHSYSLRAGPM